MYSNVAPRMASGADGPFAEKLSDAKATVLAVSTSISAATHAVPNPAGKVFTACDELSTNAAKGT